MAPRFAKLLEMLLGDVSAKKKPIYFLTRCDHTRPPLFGRTCTWHPAAGSSGAAASSPQAALPPRRPVQHGRPRPRDLTAAYACSAPPPRGIPSLGRRRGAASSPQAALPPRPCTTTQCWRLAQQAREANQAILKRLRVNWECWVAKLRPHEDGSGRSPSTSRGQEG